MRTPIAVAIRASLVTLVLTGLVYPIAVKCIAGLLFPWRAKGSLITDTKGTVIGSELIGQPFHRKEYFWPRPSAAGDSGYDPTASGGSNLGPTSAKLRERIEQEIRRLREENKDAPMPIPVELVTASASGLDPHLSPEGARWQVPRIVSARRIADRRRVEAVIDSCIEGRDLGFLGEERVNVLRLNLALDEIFGKP